MRDFTLSTLDKDTPGLVCAQGTVLRDDTSPAVLDLAGLRATAVEEIEPAVCYERLRASGVVHGPAFQALTAIRRGQGFVLADLRLPRRLAATLPELPLHPVLLDAAIQAWIALDDEAPHRRRRSVRLPRNPGHGAVRGGNGRLCQADAGCTRRERNSAVGYRSLRQQRPRLRGVQGADAASDGRRRDRGD